MAADDVTLNKYLIDLFIDYLLFLIFVKLLEKE